MPELRPYPYFFVRANGITELPAILTRHYSLPVCRGTVMCSLQSIFTTSLPPLSNCLTIGPSKASFSIRSLTSWKRQSSYIPKHFPVILNYSFWSPDGDDSTLGQSTMERIMLEMKMLKYNQRRLSTKSFISF